MSPVLTLPGLALVICAGLGGSAQPGRAEAFDCVMDPAAMVKLGAETQGQLEEILVKRGDHVVTGQIVARLNAAVEAATLEILKLKADATSVVTARRAQRDFAKDKMQRDAQLLEQKALSASVFKQDQLDYALALAQLAEAELDHETAMAERQRAQAVLEQSIVRAPMEGYVEEIMLQPGEFVTPEHPIMRLAQLDPLHVEAFLPVDLYDKVHVGSRLSVVPDGAGQGAIATTVSAVDHVFDTASMTFGLRADVPNPDAALPGGQRCRLTLDGVPE